MTTTDIKPPPFPSQDCTLLIQGQAGALEVMVAHPASVLSEAIAVICHPNPLQQGTMHNKVVTTLHKIFQMRGLVTLRFNYRGVGKSEGEFGNEVGELQDVKTVVAWMRLHYPHAPLVLAGFSFGGYIALAGATTLLPVLVVAVAPAVGRPHRPDIGSISCPILLAQGDKDEVVPLAVVTDWLAKRNESPLFLTFKDTDHFFHGKLMELRERLLESLPPL